MRDDESDVNSTAQRFEVKRLTFLCTQTKNRVRMPI